MMTDASENVVTPTDTPDPETVSEWRELCAWARQYTNSNRITIRTFCRLIGFHYYEYACKRLGPAYANKPPRKTPGSIGLKFWDCMLSYKQSGAMYERNSIDKDDYDFRSFVFHNLSVFKQLKVYYPELYFDGSTRVIDAALPGGMTDRQFREKLESMEKWPFGVSNPNVRLRLSIPL